MPMPKSTFSWETLDALAQFKITCEFASDYLGVSRDTIIRRIKEKYSLTFSEYCALKRQRTATKLQQKAIEMAIRGNATMMIFCLKNMAGWTDKVEQTHQGDVNIKLQYDLKEEDPLEAKKVAVPFM